MKNPALRLAAVAATLAIVTAAQATLVDARFTGRVATQTATSFALGASVSGEFVYDTVAARYVSFQVAGQSAAAGFASTADFSADHYTALYRAQVSPVDQGSTLNSSVLLDLEGLDLPWSGANAAALLTDASQLAGNLDRSASFFGFYTGSADGSQVRSLTASLDSLQVVAAAVPEPAVTPLLLLGGGLLVAVHLSRRGRGSAAGKREG